MSALAFNSAELAFTLNWVEPGALLMDGLGRNYVSRLLLQAKSWDELLTTACSRHIGGHNYQLFDFQSRRIANVEAALGRCAVTHISKPFFHANQYVLLNKTLNMTDQVFGLSSVHRLRRLQALPRPATPDDMLKMLGDQQDREYPIYHDSLSHANGELSDWTLATALYDIDKHEITLMHGNPSLLRVQRRFSVPRSGHDLLTIFA